MASSQTSTPLESLGINIFELAKSAKRLRHFTSSRIESILAKADEKIRISPEVLNPVVEDLCYDEHFLALAGIPYENPDSRLIKAAVAEYLLIP